MRVMIYSTIVELILLIIQASQLIKEGGKEIRIQFCETGIVPLADNMNCTGALTIQLILNWSFLFLYMYFSIISYEYYYIGAKDPKLVDAQARAEERKKTADYIRENELTQKQIENTFKKEKKR